MAGRQRGRFTTAMVSVQTVVPWEIAEEVARRAEGEFLSAATYYRRWIIEGFNKDKEKGKVK